VFRPSASEPASGSVDLEIRSRRLLARLVPGYRFPPQAQPAKLTHRRRAERCFALAPRSYPRGVFRFRNLEEARAAREQVTRESIRRGK
jgi:hypothetical protein